MMATTQPITLDRLLEFENSQQQADIRAEYGKVIALLNEKLKHGQITPTQYDRAADYQFKLMLKRIAFLAETYKL